MAILGFFNEFRIKVLARVLRKFLKNLQPENSLKKSRGSGL